MGEDAVRGKPAPDDVGGIVSPLNNELWVGPPAFCLIFWPWGFSWLQNGEGLRHYCTLGEPQRLSSSSLLHSSLKLSLRILIAPCAHGPSETASQGPWLGRLCFHVLFVTLGFWQKPFHKSNSTFPPSSNFSRACLKFLPLHVLWGDKDLGLFKTTQMLWFDWEMSPVVSGSQLVVPFGKHVVSLGGGPSLEEDITRFIWEWGLEVS